MSQVVVVSGPSRGLIGGRVLYGSKVVKGITAFASIFSRDPQVVVKTGLRDLLVYDVVQIHT